MNCCSLIIIIFYGFCWQDCSCVWAYVCLIKHHHSCLWTCWKWKHFCSSNHYNIFYSKIKSTTKKEKKRKIIVDMELLHWHNEELQFVWINIPNRQCKLQIYKTKFAIKIEKKMAHFAIVYMHQMNGYMSSVLHFSIFRLSFPLFSSPSVPNIPLL